MLHNHIHLVLGPLGASANVITYAHVGHVALHFLICFAICKDKCSRSKVFDKTLKLAQGTAYGAGIRLHLYA